MQLLLLLKAYAYDSQHVFYTNGRMLRLRVKKVTTKSNTQRLLPIKWILRDIFSDNWFTPGLSNGNYYAPLSY